MQSPMYDVKTSLPLPDTSPPEPVAEPSWQPVGDAAPARRAGTHRRLCQAGDRDAGGMLAQRQ